MQKCTIFDCEWYSYQQGAVIDNKIYVSNKEGQLTDTFTLLCGPWEDRDLPLMLFYVTTAPNDSTVAEIGDDKWGFFNVSTGDIVAQPIYEDANCFCFSTLAKVRMGQKTGFIDKTGHVVGGIEWDDAHTFSNRAALCAVRKGALWGYINAKGEVVVEPQFNEVGKWQHFESYEHDDVVSDDGHQAPIALVKKAEQYGFINDRGSYFLQPQFDQVGQWERLYAMPPIRVGATREQTIEWVFEWNASQIGHATFVSKKGKYGFINDQGHCFIKPTFDKARDFWMGYYAPVKVDGKWGFIDITGALVISPAFSDVGECGMNIYMIKQNRTWGILTSDLKIIMPEEGLKYVIYNGEQISFRGRRISSRRKVKV